MNNIKKEIQNVKTQLTKEVEKVELKETAIQLNTAVKPTMQDLKDKAITLYHLQQKHNELSNKRRELDTFAITSDSQNATIIVTDCKGLNFKSNNPKSIGKLIEFWKEEFNIAIEEIEQELLKAFEMQNQDVIKQQYLKKIA